MRVDLEIRNGRIARLAPVGSAPAAAIQLCGGLVWPGFVDFKGLLQCGHCCSLAVQDDAFVDATLNSARDAGIAIVGPPMCNMYLQGRTAGQTPRWRGVTLLHEAKAAGLSRVTTRVESRRSSGARE